MFHHKLIIIMKKKKNGKRSKNQLPSISLLYYCTVPFTKQKNESAIWQICVYLYPTLIIIILRYFLIFINQRTHKLQNHVTNLFIYLFILTTYDIFLVYVCVCAHISVHICSLMREHTETHTHTHKNITLM